MKKGLVLILAFSLLLLLIGCSSNTAQNADQEGLAKGSILYHMKINPEFEISANDDLIVVGAVAKNADAESVLASVNIAGISVNEAFNVLTEEAKAQGFLTEEKGNTVHITILKKDDKKMPTCHLCNGCGTVECLECHGTGILCDECILCNSTGIIYQDPVIEEWVTCEICGGSGYSYAPSEGCWACHGSGICYFCGGPGYVIVTNGEDGGVVYNADGTPETDTCVFCKGCGYCVNCIGAPCHRCNNDNHGENPGYVWQVRTYPDGIECPDCHGLGCIRCGDSFNGYNWCPCCWGSGIEGTGDPNYRDYYPDPTE